MRFLRTAILLLPAILPLSTANPIPASRLDEIERRWSQGESEVCHQQQTCYILAWIRSLGTSSIHAAHSYRDATPAWPIARDDALAGADLSWDERTSARRLRRRAAKDASSLIAKMKAFVVDYYRSRGMEHRAQEVSEAPVLRPRRGMRYDSAGR